MVQKMSEHIKEAVQADLKRDFWYKAGEATFNPSLPHMREPCAIEDYIIAGWRPPAPIINAKSRVTFIGCCFGSALINHLKTLDYRLPGEIDGQFIPISETLSTSFAMRQMFEWHFDGVKPDASTIKGNRLAEINFSDDLWRSTLDRLTATDVFILMISSAEVWYDEPSGAVAWRETPGANPSRQKFRTTTVEENRINLLTIHDIIRRYRPDAKIILLLSPIPMIATYRNQSCITVNSASKAVIRAAMDEAWREVEAEGRLLYCPFYEVILEGFGANPYGGHFNGDRRHINDPALDYLLRLFESIYCDIVKISKPVLQSYVDAKVSTSEIPKSLVDLADKNDRRGIQNLIDSYQDSDDEPMANLVESYAAERLGIRLAPPTEEEPFKKLDTLWETLPDRKILGPAPQILPIPSTAWDYGAFSGLIDVEEGVDLLIQVKLEVHSGLAGVLLIRPDGSSISTADCPVRPEDGLSTVELKIYHDDGPTHILVRNYNNDGVAGTAEVKDVTFKRIPIAPPAKKL